MYSSKVHVCYNRVLRVLEYSARTRVLNNFCNKHLKYSNTPVLQGCEAENINTTCNNKLLAAHVLSSSCPNSGVVVQSVPMANAHVQDERFRHILRLRFGVSCVTPLADWKCNCRGHGGPRHSDWVERASEGTRPAFPSVHFAESPCTASSA